MSRKEIEDSIAELQHFLEMARTEGAKSALNSCISSLRTELNNLPAPVVSQDTATPKAVSFTSLPSFLWDQNLDYITIYFTEGLDGVQNLPKESIQCDFQEESVELRIVGLKYKNLRWSSKLYTKIVPDKCKIFIRKDRITLKLAKIHKENWPQLQPDNKPAKPSINSDDPSAGLMDMMRDMYQSGDDNMKRVIAEAFTKARSGQSPADMADGF